MAKPCSICNHAERADIDALVRDNDLPWNEIARRYGIHPKALGRHANNGHSGEISDPPIVPIVPDPSPGEDNVPMKDRIVPTVIPKPVGSTLGTNKRTKSQRDLDLAWIVAMATHGLNAREIGEEARLKGRESVGQLHDNQIRADLRKARRLSIETAVDKDRAMLDAALAELNRVGHADLRDVMEWGPNGLKLRESIDLTEEGAAIVSGVTFKVRREPGASLDDEGTEVVDFKLETHGKVQALQTIVRHLAPVALDVNVKVSRESQIGGVADLLGLDAGTLATAVGDSEPEE